ncbi:phage baseplate assembly protein W [Rhodobacteraceae bacterium KLH11]|nr:phage baseplate assembly protein W [Rhodobacteraceae bacterium KLH11]
MSRRDISPSLGDPPRFLGKGVAFPPLLDRRWGRLEMVEGETDVQQSIKIIVLTARGERVMRPEFGCGIHELTFKPVNTQLVAEIKRTVTEALRRFEARIDVLGVNVKVSDALNGKLELDVKYRLRQTNQPRNFVFPFYISEGR